MLEPKDKLLIAIENKFGAREGRDQLTKYADALRDMYPDWTRVLIFLDIYGEPPGDEQKEWIGLDYEWLVDELREAEESPWLGSESRSAIKEFRNAIELNGETFIHIDDSDETLLEVVQDHNAVIQQMADWFKAGTSMAEIVSDLFTPTNIIERKALQQLFLVYWQRRELWRLCIPMRSYAGILVSAQRTFPSIEHDPLRTRFYFSLPEWSRFQEDAEGDWTLLVMVRILPIKDDGTVSYAVVSAMSMDNIPEIYQTGLKFIAQTVRATHMKRNRKLGEESGYIRLRVDRTDSEAKVSELLIQHLKMINKAVLPLME